MPTFVDHETEIYYEEFGDGFPLLLFAPGGMRSAIAFWENSPWNPIETLAPNFRIIAMDQRNAGQSRAPISGEDSWSTYTRDHLALLDHLKVEKTHLLGGCIGGPYCLGVMEAAAGKPVGVNAFDPDAARGYLDCGAAFMLVGADVALLARGSEALAARYCAATEPESSERASY